MPIISEFMAGNQGTLDDGDGNSSDWIELFNAGDTEVDLNGYHLTDDPQDLSRWDFPQKTLAAGEYLVVFASGQQTSDYVDVGGNLHTNFQLNRQGEYLALVAPDDTIVSEYGTATVEFPEQLTDLSYGIAQPLPAEGQAKVGYQLAPTPGEANGDVDQVFRGFVGDTRFSVDRGFYQSPQTVEITTDTAGAMIIYTTDGSVPTPENGTQVPAVNAGSPALAVVSVTTTTTLRAAAYKDDYLPSNTDTHTYIFVDDVAQQGNTPSGYPNRWKNGLQTLPADYEMDPEITQNPAYVDLMDTALLAVPTISIVTDVDHLFDEDTGIYMNSEAQGVAWERPASVEYIFPDGTEGFQEDAGLRIQGGASRDPGLSPKHSFRLLFKSQYGDSKLRYPLFGPDATEEFDTVILRAGFNDGWTRHNELQRDSRTVAQYARDQWVKNTQLAMGHVAPHNNYAHLYLNGIYWGLYNPTERPSAPFAASYFGGDKEDYEVINSGNIVDGSLRKWNEMFRLAEAGLEGDAEYQAISEMLDIDTFIDYMLLNQYIGNRDWDTQNYYLNRRTEPEGKFYWIVWDSEFIFVDVDDNIITVDRTLGGRGPVRLFLQLTENAEFREQFANRIAEHFFGEGLLTPEKVVERWESLSDQAIDAVIAESARWGDYRRDVDPDVAPFELLERDVQWMEERNRLLNEYFPFRTEKMIQQYIALGLFPDLPVPIYSQDGGEIQEPLELSISVLAGTVYYTLDGTDPMAGESVADRWTLLEAGAPARGLVPTDDALGTSWTATTFDDALWKSGSTGVGYEQRSGYEDLIELDLFSEMFGLYSSAYIRIPFELTDLAAIDSLWLNMQYDDGFVAYLNGVEVARRNASDPVSWDMKSDGVRSDQDVLEFESVNISRFLDRLQVGQNVLAIHGLNSRTRDNDFLIVPELVGGTITDTGASDSAIRYTGPIVVSDETVVKARTLLGSDWSSLSQAEFTVAPGPPALRVSEVMYRPSNPTALELTSGFDDADDFEYLELTNIGNQVIDLSDIQLVEGVTFDFGSSLVTELRPGQSVVVVEDLAAFQFRYGNQIPVAGEWSGQLSNGGETLGVAFAGELLQQFTYDDAWYPGTDGGGQSLEIVDAANPDLNTWSDPSGWRASEVGGTPGRPTLIVRPGDANRDGVFDSTDLVQILEAGEYEDALAGNSTWEEGDFNGDGDFTTDDLVLALQLGRYIGQPPP